MKSIWIDDDKHQGVKVEAAKRGCTIVDVFNDMYYSYFNIDKRTGEKKDFFKIKDE